MTIDDDLLLKVQYNWVVDMVKRMEIILTTDATDEEKLQQISYLVKQALKAESRNND